ncbi:hypothetical protein [Thiomicrospira microaerophila]|uniref:hypothetical protein n=1 Tax=Thiomicrospira microaerophila TaxID=406020 RepID=UPI0005C87DC2|nr:hypothetical protein [Thiomicrospira microaerophila]
MSRLFWLHDECLAKPADCQPADRWVYIWDQAYFNNQAWSAKRLFFIFETLVDLAQQGAEIYQAPTASGLTALVEQHGFEQVITFSANDPVLNQLIVDVQLKIPHLTCMAQPGLVDRDLLKPAKRFFQYWKQVEKPLLGEKLTTTHQRVR